MTEGVGNGSGPQHESSRTNREEKPSGLEENDGFVVGDVHRKNPLYRNSGDPDRKSGGTFEVVSAQSPTPPEEVFGFGEEPAVQETKADGKEAAAAKVEPAPAAEDPEAAAKAKKAARLAAIREKREARKKEEWMNLMDALSVIDSL